MRVQVRQLKGRGNTETIKHHDESFVGLRTHIVEINGRVRVEVCEGHGRDTKRTKFETEAEALAHVAGLVA